MNKEVFPWDGASDIRTFFIDDLINDDVDICRVADKNCHMQTVPVNSTYQQQAVSQTAVIDYVNRAWMAEELEREKELLCAVAPALRFERNGDRLVDGFRFRAGHGHDAAVDAVGVQRMPQFGAMMDFCNEHATAAAGRSASRGADVQPIFPAGERHSGRARAVDANRPVSVRQSVHERVATVCNGAQKFPRHLFHPRDIRSPDLAMDCAARCLPKPTVEDRAKFEQWDPKIHSKEVLQHAGEQIVALSGWGSNDSNRFSGDRLYVEEMRDLCEVFYAYYKGTDPSGNRQGDGDDLPSVDQTSGPDTYLIPIYMANIPLCFV